MDEIAKALKSPIWWFSACFVAILTSLLAGYLKDLCSVAAGSLSHRMHRRRRRQFRRDARVLRKLSRDRALLAAYGVTVMHDFAIVVATLFFALAAPPAVYFYHTHPDWDVFPQLSPPGIPRFLPIATLFIALTGMLYGFTLPRKLRLYSRAMRKALR